MNTFGSTIKNMLKTVLYFKTIFNAGFIHIQDLLTMRVFSEFRNNRKYTMENQNVKTYCKNKFYQNMQL